MLRPTGSAEVGPATHALTSARLPGRTGLHVIVLRGGRIATISRDDGSRPAGATIVSADGRWVLPGLHDPHLHLLSLARSLTVCDLPAGVRAPEALSAILRSRAHALPSSAWLDARHFDHHRMTGGWIPDRRALDRIVRTRPLRLRHRNQRIDVLNSAALAECGLLSGPTPDGVETDAMGHPTGRLYNCGRLIRERRPARWGVQQLRDAVALASRTLLEQGVTSVQDATAHNGVQELGLLDRLACDRVIRQRLWTMASGEGLAAGAVPDEALVRTRHAKLLALESRLDLDSLIGQARAARRSGLAVAIHATSEAEIAAAVAVIEAAGAGPVSGRPDRIEHGFVASDATVAAVAKSGAAVVINPSLIAEAGDIYRSGCGPEQRAMLHRAASWHRAGARIAIASDAPVTRSSALEALTVAITRLAPDGEPLGAPERLSPRRALASLTAAPADLIGERALGRLARGAVADLIITSGATPFGSRVEATILNGELAFVRGPFEEARRAGMKPPAGSA